MRLRLMDQQQALEFLIAQTTHIEAEVYQVQYPDIQYPSLIPVDTSANEWAKSVTFFSMDRVGKAEWFNHLATNMALADVNRAKYESTIEMAGIGYTYTLEELGNAAMIPGNNLSSDRAEAARRAYEEFVDRIAFTGDTAKGFQGLLNNSAVTRVDAAADGTGGTAAEKRLWANKTGDQMIRDINDALGGIYTGSLTVEMADTVLLPIEAMNTIANMRLASTEANALKWLRENNVYTQTTNQPLTIRGVLGAEAAGAGGVGRMVVYRRIPQVLKMHIPMVHRFLEVWRRGPIVYDVPGIFRLGGVEIRRPGAVRYVDGITAAA